MSGAQHERALGLLAARVARASDYGSPDELPTLYPVEIQIDNETDDRYTVLHIEAAFKTDQKQAAVAWTAYDGKSQRPNFDPNNRLQFDIVGDGRFRTYKVDLSSAESYRGAMSYLFFRPSLAPEEGGWVKIKRIRLGK